MAYKQTLEVLKNNCIETLNDPLDKIVKPVDDTINGGEYSPLLLPSLEKFKTVSALDDDLVQLRAGGAVNSEDLTTTNIETVERNIEYWHRDVHMEQYIPENASAKKAFIYFHGGSFYGGQIEDVRNMLKYIAEQSSTTVFNIDYKLAPENPFPEGILDGVAVSLYVQQCLGFENIILGGDSAGGNVSIAVDNLLNRLGYQSSAANILLYPVVTLADDHNEELWDLSSYPIDQAQIAIRNNYRKLFHSLNAIMRKYYLTHDENPNLDLISPLHGRDNLQKANTLLIVGEYDFFRLQDEAYAKLLNENETDVKFLQYNGMAHAFAPMIGVLPQADDACLEMAQFISEV